MPEDPLTNYALAIIVGVLSSAIASVIFLLALRRLRPNIAIADKIAKVPAGLVADESLGDLYTFKMINRTRFPRSPLVNVKAEVEFCRYTGSPRGDPVSKASSTLARAGRSTRCQSVPLRRGDMTYVKKFEPNDDDAEYAVVFRIDRGTDLGQLWTAEPTAFVRFSVYSVHPVSGIHGIHIMEYRDMTTCICPGRYAHGNDLTIH